MSERNYKKTRLSCYTGYVTQAITVNLAPLLFVIFQQKFELSLSFIALIPLVTFLIQILIDAAAVFFAERLSFRFLAVSSQLTSFCGLALLSFLPEIIDAKVGILVAILVYSSGSALAEVVISPLIDALPKKEDGGSAMTFLHSFYSWGQAVVILLTTLLVRIIGNSLWNIIPLVWAVLPLFNTVSFALVPMPEKLSCDEDSVPWKILLKPSFALAFLLMICAGAAEQVMAQWASMFAEKGLGISKVAGDIVGPCAFAVFMGIGRLLHGLYGGRINMKKLLCALSGVTIFCYIITVFAPIPFVSLVGCGLCGIGVSVMWPGMLQLCSTTYPGAGVSMFAILALGGDIGCSVGPYLSGKVSDAVGTSQRFANLAAELSLTSEQLGLRAGFAAALIFPLIMLFGVLMMKNEVSEK